MFGLLEVESNLLDQSLSRGKLTLGAQVVEQGELDGRAIDVAAEVDDVCLDATRAFGDHRGAVANVDHRAIALATYGDLSCPHAVLHPLVDGMGGSDVGGGETHLLT